MKMLVDGDDNTCDDDGDVRNNGDVSEDSSVCNDGDPINLEKAVWKRKKN